MNPNASGTFGIYVRLNGIPDIQDKIKETINPSINNRIMTRVHTPVHFSSLDDCSASTARIETRIGRQSRKPNLHRNDPRTDGTIWYCVQLGRKYHSNPAPILPAQPLCCGERLVRSELLV